MGQEATKEKEKDKGRPPIPIFVNEQEVKMTEATATGAQIKAAAIAQGVHIQQNFMLIEELMGLLIIEKQRAVNLKEFYDLLLNTFIRLLNLLYGIEKIIARLAKMLLLDFYTTLFPEDEEKE